jgi:ParB family protein of integrating conjugative element (PFGI_1 class)
MRTDEIKAFTTADLLELDQKLARQSAEQQIAHCGGAISTIRIKVDQVVAFEGNPRVQEYVEFDQFLAGIRARGLESLLAVTRRPGSKIYILARGGKSRLRALQILAKEDPKKWAEQDFLVVPYVSETDLLAAHLVENLERQDMCFWDTAASISRMYADLSTERNKAMSLREFEKALAERGVHIGLDAIHNMLFSVEQLHGLGPWKRHLAGKHVSHTLRPRLIAIRALWDLHSDKSNESFNIMMDDAIEHHVAASTAQRQDYDPDKLLNAITASAANALGYAVGKFSHAVDVQMKGGITSLAELKRTISMSTDGGDADPLGHHDGGVGFHASASECAPITAPASRVEVTSPVIALADDDLERSTSHFHLEQGAGGHQPDGTVVPEVSPQVSPPKSKNATSAHHPKLDFQGNDPAWIELEECVGRLAAAAGIKALVNSTRGLPYRYYMELPMPGALGTTHQGLAMQGWWLLAGLAGQLDSDTLDSVSEQKHALPIFEEVSKGSFARAVAHPETWMEALETCLGGDEMDPFALLRSVLTNLDHVFYRDTIELLGACAYCNSLHGN